MKQIIFAVLSIMPISGILAEPRTGDDIYKKFCTTCHSIALANAPKTHDEAAWKSRNKDVAAFVESSKKGLNAMPPYGLCTDCTDAELKAAIEFMMNKAK